MKFKKFLSMALAAAMALSLTVPASAEGETWKHVEDETILDQFEEEGGATVDLTGNTEVYVKRGTQAVIWVAGNDARENSEIVKTAVTNDNSMNGKTVTAIIRGDTVYTIETGEDGNHVILDTVEIRNKTTTIYKYEDANATCGELVTGSITTVAVSGMTMTIVGNISHLTFSHTVPDSLKPTDPDGGGTVSALFTLYKVVEGDTKLDGFTFDIKDSEGNVVGTLTSDENGLVTDTIELAPGDYTIVETNEDLTKYEDNTQVLNAQVDENGNVTLDVVNEVTQDTFVNVYKLGKLDVTGNAIKAWYDEYHKLVYKYYEYDTLVAGINPKTGNIDPAGYGIEGHYLGNGMTYLTIDKADLADGPVELNISQSNKSGGGKKGNTDKWNTPVTGDWTFTLSMNEQGQLVVDASAFADIMTPAEGATPAFGVAVYPEGAAVGGCRDIKHDSNTTYDLPAGDTFEFFIHWENSRYTLGEIIGCEVDYLVPKFEEIDNDVTVSVTDAESEEVATGALADFDTLELEAGSYTVTLTYEGEVIGTKTVTVEAGKTVTADFGKLTVWGENVIVFCPFVPDYGTEHGIFPDNPIDPTMPI